MDIRIPAYYVASEASPEVIDALRIHPIMCAIIWRDQDRDIACQLAPEIVRTNTEQEAFDLAQWMPEKVDRPSVVIGGSYPLEAVYSDGEKEIICN